MRQAPCAKDEFRRGRRTGKGMVGGIAWGWALPVFLLIWFSRARIKEEVAGWN